MSSQIVLIYESVDEISFNLVDFKLASRSPLDFKTSDLGNNIPFVKLFPCMVASTTSVSIFKVWLVGTVPHLDFFCSMFGGVAVVVAYRKKTNNVIEITFQNC